ncbi:MAG TPA: EAL domain-containing protein [Sphingomicrobium sp.]|nr:EAL domain-containing protein [Sphingomicrobium sp.]
MSQGEIVILEAFRERAGETGAAREPVPLRQLLSFRAPRDSVSAAVQRAQLDALVRLVPATVVTQLIAAALVALSLRGPVPDAHLALWFGAIFLICALRGVRAHRLRSDPDYARRKPPRLNAIVAIITILAILWVVPAGLWFGLVDVEHQMMLGIVIVALMSAGSVTLGSVPQASLAYITIMMLGGLAMTTRFADPIHSLLIIVFSAVIARAAIATGRRFIGYVRSQIELQEQSELIKLLREFEASGCDWLWETGSDGNLSYMSPAMAEAAGAPLAKLIGRNAQKVLDPDGRAAQLSAGVRTIRDHVSRREAFRDVAIPVQHGRRWWSLSGKPLFDASGEFLGWRGVGSDITDVRLTGTDSVRAARLDPLTGVANRLLLREQLEEALLRQLGGEGGCALLLVDLDRFKLVNDTLGHSVGDQLLCDVARRIEACIGNDGVVGRLGGDEFAIVWRGDTDDETLAAVAGRVIDDVNRTLTIGAAQIRVGATIGIARAPVDGDREEVLMRCADLALYRGKEAGRGGYAFFEPQMFVDADDYRSLENDLRNALGSAGLDLHYQPIVDAETDAVVAREALLRWNHPTRGSIPPDQFVPIIEDAGLMHQIGEWVIRQACAEAVSWPDDICIAVNISAAQLSGPGITETVVSALAASGLAPERLELEVTERIFLGDDASTLAALERLRSIGVRLVLDDFGKGYSSFGYLSRASFAKIKIDRSFVHGAAQGQRECVAIVKAILALAKGLDMDVTAEGVENEHEAQAMRELGCDHLQGFLFAVPLPAGELPRPRLQRFA